MYSFAQDQAGGSSQLWGSSLARREIGAAISTLEEAGSTMVALVDSSDWQSEGFRALNGLLARLRDETAVEIGNLKVREWELGDGAAE